MVAKISIGSSLYGALSYNGMKMNRDEGRVLGANKIILPADGHIDIARMVENFNLFMPKMGRTKKPVLHIFLNPHPDDKLTEQQYEILAREYLDKLGFGEQPFIIYKHMDIDRHHIHIVTVNVNEQGKRLNQDFLFRRSKRITAELKEHNIDVVLRYTEEGRIYGVTFIDHSTMTVLNGSRLGKEFSANAINERFNNPANAHINSPDVVAPIVVPPIEPTLGDTHSDTAQEPAVNQPSSGQHQHTVTQSVYDFGDYDLPIPGLDLFQQGQSFNPDEEEFRRRMQRKKKRGPRHRF